ncbi:hypothetical protein C8Q74DRAFT_1367843 [Fomes fomentarius]|nr:hypothetical protein C8Q74DRAFT_1367843 [Fomes fomentarius]
MANSDQSPSSSYLRPLSPPVSLQLAFVARPAPSSIPTELALNAAETCAVTSTGSHRWRAHAISATISHAPQRPVQRGSASWAITKPSVHGAVSSPADDAAGNVRGPGSAFPTVPPATNASLSHPVTSLQHSPCAPPVVAITIPPSDLCPPAGRRTPHVIFRSDTQTLVGESTIIAHLRTLSTTAPSPSRRPPLPVNTQAALSSRLAAAPEYNGSRIDLTGVQALDRPSAAHCRSDSPPSSISVSSSSPPFPRLQLPARTGLSRFPMQAGQSG